MRVRLGDNGDPTKAMIEALRKVIKRMHYPLEVMLTYVRWYVAYPLSLRHIEEMMAERGVFVDHATVHRWALRIVPALVKVFRGRKRAVGKSWRMDETYIKVRGEWKYLYRAVDRDGDTVDFLFTVRRDRASGGSLSRARNRSAWRTREDHDRQERRRHCGHRQLQRRARG